MYRYHAWIRCFSLLALLWVMPTGTLAAPAQQQMITVQQGDTLYQLARRHDCDIQQLAELNKLTDVSLIREGQTLRLPANERQKQATVQPTISQRNREKQANFFARGQDLGQFTITAYTAGPESTGKRRGDPAYGVTASGQPVVDGLTIAVDPDVIPIGSRVYIEGIGYRVAQDIGSAIQGKRIDLFLNDLSAAKQFGVKKDVRVELVE
jgi:3D (Asp-Asp-Asp) domain-containing protein